MVPATTITMQQLQALCNDSAQVQPGSDVHRALLLAQLPDFNFHPTARRRGTMVVDGYGTEYPMPTTMLSHVTDGALLFSCTDPKSPGAQLALHLSQPRMKTLVLTLNRHRTVNNAFSK